MSSTLPTASGTVLVVDDDQLVLRTIRRALERLGLRVVVVNRPFGLLNLIAETQPLLVLLDLSMPGLDGASLVELIRKDRALASTRIFLHSGLDEQTLAAKAIECGADGYLPKSARPVELARLVSRMARPAA